MKEVDVSSGLADPAPEVRKLNGEFYDTFFISAFEQVSLYRALAQLVNELEDELGHILVEALAPSSYVEDDQMVYTLLMTVSH